MFEAFTCASQCLSQDAVKCIDEKTENVIKTSDLQPTVNTKEPQHVKRPQKALTFKPISLGHFDLHHLTPKGYIWAQF
jgi:hypothetical protein